MRKKKESQFFVDPTAKINVPLRFLQGCIKSKNVIDSEEVTLPENIYIGAYVVIGQNVKIGDKVVIDAFSKISSGVVIGKNSLIIYRAMIGGDAQIGDDCVIGGVVPERGKIGNRCKIFGNIVHTHSDSTMSWDHHKIPEPSIVMHDDCFVGFGANVIGGFEVGPKSYICAGALVTKNVPPYHIASGVNEIIHFSKWKGELKNNPLFSK